MADRERLREYWRDNRREFAHNLSLAWPFFVGLVLFLLVSSFLFYWAEGGAQRAPRTWADAIYLTWMTMTTVGNLEATTVIGRVLAALDALTGLVSFGVVVWLITASLSRR
jgi:hypothetical protein